MSWRGCLPSVCKQKKRNIKSLASLLVGPHVAWSVNYFWWQKGANLETLVADLGAD